MGSMKTSRHAAVFCISLSAHDFENLRKNKKVY